MTVQGTVDPRFAAVREAFAASFAEGLESGGAVAVMAGGCLVVDLWGGHADAAGTRPWTRDTMVNLWSASKGIMAGAVAMAVERGRLAYEAPVAHAWPQFAAAGKEAITLDLVMSHRAGLNGLAVEMDEAGTHAWFPYVEALAAMAPLWPPGSLCVYHPVSYGFLAGETLRRVDGRSPGRFVAEEMVGPLGLSSFFLGVPAGEDHRVAEVVGGPKNDNWVAAVAASAHPEATANPVLHAGMANSRAWRAAQIPAANGTGDAAALATIYAALAGAGPGGRRLLSADGLAAATALRYRGPESSTGGEVTLGAGYRLGGPGSELGPNPRAFGHTGWGGALGFGDPDAGLGFAYVTQRMLGFDDGIDPRRTRLIEAVYDAL